MKIVVAAAVSQIGYWVVRRAAEDGHQIIAGHHRRRFARPIGPENWTAIDLQHPDGGLMTGGAAGADVFIHCGPPQFAPSAARLAAALRCRAVIAFGSTSALYHDRPAPVGDTVKAAMLRRLEQEFSAACTQNRINGMLFRPTLVYGAGMDQNVCRLARMASRLPVLPLPPDADGLRQPVHAADIASLVLAAAEIAIRQTGTQTPIFDIGGGERVLYREMVRRIAQATGHTPPILTCPGLAGAARLAAMIRPSLAPTVSALYRMGADQVVDNSAAQLEFGYEPRGFAPTRSELTSPVHPLAE